MTRLQLKEVSGVGLTKVVTAQKISNCHINHAQKIERRFTVTAENVRKKLQPIF